MSGYNCFALVVICVVLILLWICLEKVRTYGNAVTPLLELSAYLAFVVGFSYILDQKTANPDIAHLCGLAALAIGAILLALAEIIRLLYRKK